MELSIDLAGVLANACFALSEKGSVTELACTAFCWLYIYAFGFCHTALIFSIYYEYFFILLIFGAGF